jgi:hypothetical protein
VPDLGGALPPAPAQLRDRAAGGKRLDPVASTVTVAQLHTLPRREQIEPSVILPRLASLREGSCEEILGRERPAAARAAIPQVVAAHQLCVLQRLVGGEVRHQPPIAPGGGVAVEHQHAAAVPGQCEDLAQAAGGVGVAGEHAGSCATGRSGERAHRRGEVES